MQELARQDATLAPDLSGALTAFNRIGCNSSSSPTIGHSDVIRIFGLSIRFPPKLPIPRRSSQLAMSTAAAVARWNKSKFLRSTYPLAVDRPPLWP